MRGEKQAFGRFVIVGAVTAAASVLAITALVQYAGWTPLMSAIVIAFAGNFWGFYANRQWSFLVQHGHPMLQLARYLVVAMVAIACSVGLFAALTEILRMHYVIASLVVSATFAVTNFLAHFHWSFATGSWRSRS